jgi:hypothetical protein
LIGCAGAQPAPYSGVAAAAYLRPNASAKVPYMYGAEVNWSDYSKVILEPVEVYDGPDNQFGDMPRGDRDALANYMQAQFGQTLSKRFANTQTPGGRTLRIKLTLAGAAKSKQVLSTLSRFDLAGGLYNNVQAVRGREGIMTGWVMYTVEIYDASSNTLLKAFEAKQYPNAINIKATVGSLSAARTGIDKGAKMLVAELS